MKTKSCNDIHRQWNRLHRLTYGIEPYSVPEHKKNRMALVNKIYERYRKNIIQEHDRVFGYRTYRDLDFKVSKEIYTR